MAETSHHPTDRESRLQEVLLAYVEADEAGQAPRSEDWLARHPEFAGELGKFLEGRAHLDRAAAPLRALLAEPPAEVGPDPARPGLLGDFRILREVGRGGMGVVYEAEQVSLGRRVALKVLPFAATMDPRQLQRFQNEARAAASLEHPHIVPVHGVGCERGVHYYAMKFIEGQSLAGLIRRQPADRASTAVSAAGPLEAPTPARSAESATAPGAAARTERAPRDAAAFRQVGQWGVEATEALEHAHGVGIVHRDIKPANLMIDRQGGLWVTDFGLARTAADAGLTLTGDVLGTLRYMSPEQALAKHGLVDHRTDIYSLGATLYELLSGAPAVDGEDREAILNAITREEPRPPRKIDRSIPAELETIVLKAMEKDPQGRYATAQELADDLRRWLEDRPIQARPPALGTRLRRWGRRHQPLVAAVAAALVMGLAVLGASIGWVVRDRALRGAEATRVVTVALDESASWQEQRRLPEALSAARRADGLLAGADVDEALHERVGARLADLQLLERLENVRLEKQTEVKDGKFDWQGADERYAQTFRDAGLDVEALPAEEAAEHIGRSTVAAELAAMLDHWAMVRRNARGAADKTWKHLLRVARLADPDAGRTRCGRRWNAGTRRRF
jgi:serine/threonine protein kinase